MRRRVFPLGRMALDAWVLEIAAGAVCVLALWLPLSGGAGWRAPVQAGLGALVLLGMVTRRRWPVAAFVVAAAATGVAAALGLTHDPFVGAGWVLYVVALSRGAIGAPPVHTVVLSGMLVVAVLVGGTTVEQARYVVMSAAALGGAWALGSVIGRERVEARRSARARAEAAASAERLRVVREVHDIVSHSLGMVSVVSAVARHNLSADANALRAKLATIEQASGGALAEMRAVLGAVRADDGASRCPWPGLADLDELVGRSRAAGTRTTLTVSGVDRSAAATELAVYRVVQEGLTNAVRHAREAPCAVSVAQSDGLVTVEVANEAPPAPSPPRRQAAAGLGLSGLRERIELLGGSLEAGERPGGGFALRAQIPTHGAHGR